MLFITVVVPRTLLACWSGWQAHRMSERFALSFDEQYYRNILRARRTDPIRIQVLPYAQTLADDAQQSLRLQSGPFFESRRSYPQTAVRRLLRGATSRRSNAVGDCRPGS